jgi:hypothetical protein
MNGPSDAQNTSGTCADVGEGWRERRARKRAARRAEERKEPALSAEKRARRNATDRQRRARESEAERTERRERDRAKQQKRRKGVTEEERAERIERDRAKQQKRRMGKTEEERAERRKRNRAGEQRRRKGEPEEMRELRKEGDRERHRLRLEMQRDHDLTGRGAEKTAREVAVRAFQEGLLKPYWTPCISCGEGKWTAIKEKPWDEHLLRPLLVDEKSSRTDRYIVGHGMRSVRVNGNNAGLVMMTICDRCAAHLNRVRTAPSMSLRAGSWVGEVPPELSELSRLQANNKFYNDVVIDEEAMAALEQDAQHVAYLDQEAGDMDDLEGMSYHDGN